MTDLVASAADFSFACVADEPVRLAYAGVDFALHLPVGVRFELPAAYAEYTLPGGTAPTAARIDCHVVVDTTLGPERGNLNRVTWRRDGSRLLLDNARVNASIERVAGGVYRAEVRLADTRGREQQIALPEVDNRPALPETQAGPAALLRFVAAALVEAEGGLNLHAAAVDIDGVAVVFCGPSGAGKSTACDLCVGAHCLAYDQLALYPVGDRFYAWALPWGNSSSLPRGSACVLPVGALLRVTRGLPQTTVQLVDAATALFLVRDAATVSDESMDGEQQRLEACLAVVNGIEVGYLYTVLGQRIDEALRTSLACFATRRGERVREEVASWAT